MFWDGDSGSPNVGWATKMQPRPVLFNVAAQSMLLKCQPSSGVRFCHYADAHGDPEYATVTQFHLAFNRNYSRDNQEVSIVVI